MKTNKNKLSFLTGAFIANFIIHVAIILLIINLWKLIHN